jgi:hypothetical protein
MTSPLTAAGQYASAVPFFDKVALDSNLASSGEDMFRIRAYKLYEDFYHNRPEMFKVLLRGEDQDGLELYIPSARKMVDAANRFLAKDFSYVVSPKFGDNAQRAEAELAMSNLFKREKMHSKFNNQRRYYLIRGDALWHITADETKLPGSKISIHELNPSNYFAIEDPDNSDRLLGAHLVDFVQDPNKPDDRSAKIVRRQTYLRANAVLDKNGGYFVPLGSDPGGWTSALTFWEIGKWDDRYLKTADLKPVSNPATKPQFALDARITSMPIYHWKNNQIPGQTYGLSEIAGVETLISGINQSLTDENLTLVMQGLGVYATDAAPPKNADGTDGDWTIGPATVAEVGQGNFFNRVSGVSTVAPFQDHSKSLHEHMSQALGIPEIAQGRVDVTVAESGISLSLQLGPILSNNEVKEVEILGTHDQMFYDLMTMWFPVFESLDLPDVRVVSVVGDPMPVNREARIQEILLLQASGLITIAQAQAKLSQYGYTFDEGDDLKVVQEAAAIAAAQNGDELANRWAQEIEGQAKNWSANIGTSSVASAAVQGTGAPSVTTVTNNNAGPGAR